MIDENAPLRSGLRRVGTIPRSHRSAQPCNARMGMRSFEKRRRNRSLQLQPCGACSVDSPSVLHMRSLADRVPKRVACMHRSDVDWTIRTACATLLYVMHLPTGTHRAANTQEVEPAFPPCSQATAAGCLVELPLLGGRADDLRAARQGRAPLGHRR